MRVKRILLSLIGILLVGCTLDLGDFVVTPTIEYEETGVVVVSATPVEEVIQTPSPIVPVDATPVPVCITPTPSDYQEVYEYLETGEWTIRCLAPSGCRVRREPSFSKDSSIEFYVLPEGARVVVTAIYYCSGLEQCESEVPLWFYTEDMWWASGLVWIIE